jgi:hypothetical protein
MEFCKQFNRTKINPAKYAQYKLLCIKTNHLNLLLKLRLAVQLMEAAKLKSGSVIVKKVASVTWNKLELLLKTRCLT